VASRGRVALIALGAGVGVPVLFVFTVWLILAVSDDGLGMDEATKQRLF